MAGEKRRAKLRSLLKTAGAADIDTRLVEQAFVHESASREGGGASNERLEFYGDAILGYVTARWLMARYPDASEGELHRRKAALVSGEACAKSARRLGFGELMQLGAGMAQTGGAENATILADAFEAFLGVLERSTDLERVARFIEREHLVPADKGATGAADAKTALQEIAQAALHVTPIYIDRAEGAPQDRRYTSQVRVGDEILGEGIGPSKKAAQLSAAAMAVNALQKRHPQALEPRASKDDGRVIALDKRRRSPSPRKPGAPT